jgi:hypothetical protein
MTPDSQDGSRDAQLTSTKRVTPLAKIEDRTAHRLKAKRLVLVSVFPKATSTTDHVKCDEFIWDAITDLKDVH